MTRGRRRDPAIGHAILDAASELLVQVGYANLTMAAVAARAGITKPTLYLRYPAKAPLVFDVVFGKTKVRPMPHHGNVEADLQEAYGWAVDEVSAPEARAAMPGLIAEMAASPEMAEFTRAAFLAPEYNRVKAGLEEGRERGEIRADVDLDLIIDAFIGTAVARLTLLDHSVDHEYGRRLVDLLLYGAAPREERQHLATST